MRCAPPPVGLPCDSIGMRWEVALTVAVVVGVTYAVNTVKIKAVASSRPLWAASLEGSQALLYVYALLKIVEGYNSSLVVSAYVIGAFLGTLLAMKMRVQRAEACRCCGHTIVTEVAAHDLPDGSRRPISGTGS